MALDKGTGGYYDKFDKKRPETTEAARKEQIEYNKVTKPKPGIGGPGGPGDQTKPPETYTSSDVAYTDRPYSSAWNRYERQQERRLQAEREARQRAADDSARVATGNLNRAVDSGLSEAYLANERNKVSAQNMGAVSGYGGASETSLMGQQANYMNNRGKLEDRRAEELGDIEARRMQGSMAAEQDYQSKLYQFAMQKYDAERQAQLQNAKAAQGSKSARSRGYYDPLYYEDGGEE